MDVKLIATKDCSHCKNLSKELEDLGIKHTVHFVEEEVELCQKLAIRHSPNLVVDDEVVFRRQPSKNELRELFNL